MPSKPIVLFLCTENAARSQMAEAFLKRYAGDQFEVLSAGYRPSAIHPLTLQVMREAGYDLSQHRSKDLREYLGRGLFHYLITVCDQAEENCPKAWPGVEQLHHMNWPIEDVGAFVGTPEETLTHFRQVRNQIEQKVREFVAETARAARPA